jgi:hypothetical protein
VFGLEGFGLVEVILGAEAEHVDLVCILSSELLDAGGFPVTRRSMRRPEPHQQRLLPVKERRQGNGLTGLDVGHVHDRKRIGW